MKGIQLNLKAVRKFIAENDISRNEDYLEAKLPFSDFGIKASKTEQEINLLNYKTGFAQTIGKVFDDQIFFYTNLLPKQENEIAGSVKTSEEYGLHLIEMGALQRELKKNNNTQPRRLKL